ncbi:hypothetical protein M378DRAFT_6299 [Amanita muscaria Koide BX008]|uniref:Methyltransferase domain-containing protein n=1 Tax=Amanita muscaria (strain Koide BX008) TaxID=946122 RepID=A0A0C2XAZ3_AMAMK|nr:hypothetical protein M378DRAFT_6299 [Amanita muscaria Koide BX008]
MSAHIDKTNSSYFAFTPPSKHRPRSPYQHRISGAHYRPVSSLLAEVSHRPHCLSEQRRSIRPVSYFGDLIKDMRLREPGKTPLRSTTPLAAQANDRILSPQRILFRLKTKQSMPLLTTFTQKPPANNNKRTPSPVSSPTMTLPYLDPRNTSTDKKSWIRKDYTFLHPFPSEAPYMQSYDPTVLENDRYTELLIQRLTPDGSPTFHDYGSKPPQAVLDLGCGQGHWVLTAAEVWTTSHFIGFDLVDLTSHIQKPDNVTFVRGNFLKPRLPFANKQFDLVRMANLSLCIPQAKWESLLSEVFRVLAVNGRLELIDDQIFFPYGPTPKSKPSTVRRTSQSTFDWDDDEDTLDWSMDTDTTLLNELDTSSEGTDSFLDLRPLRRHSDQSTMADLHFEKPCPGRPASTISMSRMVDASMWAEQVGQCRNVETIFENMLKMKHDINPHPSHSLPDIMRSVFGNGVGEQRTLHLKLAPANADEIFDLRAGRSSEDVSSDGEGCRSTHSSDSGLSFPTPKPDTISAKAAGRLGITYSALAAAAASVRPRNQTTRTQSPGLILWPSTYLPMAPLELEMHACKNLHVLLGCKHALEAYMQSFEETDGKKFMDSHVIRDVLWEYECFRRERFHWPADLPSLGMQYASEEPTKSRPSLKMSAASSICPFTEDELTHVRTIHVFEAIKSGEHSLANLQFPRYPTPIPPSS